MNQAAVVTTESESTLKGRRTGRSPGTLANLKRIAESRRGKPKSEVFKKKDSSGNVKSIVSELSSVSETITDLNTKALINKLIENSEEQGKLSPSERKSDDKTLIKHLKTARKQLLSLLTIEKMQECKAMDLGRLLTIIDDRIRLSEEGGHGSYERRIIISGDAVGRKRVEMVETVTQGAEKPRMTFPGRHEDGYMGPPPSVPKCLPNV